MSSCNKDNHMQIDVKKVTDQYAICNLYTPVSCVEIVMRKSDYEFLVHKGFFIRDGKEKDSAGILNTTDTYYSLNN